VIAVPLVGPALIGARPLRYTPALPGRELPERLDAAEEAQHASLEQRRGTLVVVGQAVVGEQVPVA
jgi:hypothetical protein